MATPDPAVGIVELDKIYSDSMDVVAEFTRELEVIENKQRTALAAFKRGEKKRKLAAEELLPLRRKAAADAKAAHDKILALRSVSEATSTTRRMAMELFARCMDPHKVWQDGRVHCKCRCYAQR